jgi:hypothetical protein
VVQSIRDRREEEPRIVGRPWKHDRDILFPSQVLVSLMYGHPPCRGEPLRQACQAFRERRLREWVLNKR